MRLWSVLKRSSGSVAQGKRSAGFLGIKLKWGVGLILILILAAGIRVQHIRADPPEILPSISGSAGIYFDEGIYCHNARNKVLFGRWITDEWNPVVYNAPLTLIYFLGFKLFGISIVTVKLINVLFGMAAILLFYWGVRAYTRPGPAVGLTALFALDFYGVMFNRIGLLENFSVLCCLLSFVLFARAGEKRSTFWFLGMTAGLTVLSKYLFAWFFISTLLAVAFRAVRRKEARSLAAFMSGALAVAALWFVSIYIPFRSTFSKIGSGWGMLSLPRSPGQALSNLVHHPLHRYLQLMPVPGFLLVLFLGLALWKMLRPKSADANPIDAFVFLWIAGAALSMGLLNYRPLRYYLPLFPAIYLGISLLFRERDRIRSGGRWFWFLTVVSAFFFLPFFRMLFTGKSAFSVFPPGSLLVALAAFSAAALFFVLKGRRARAWTAASVMAATLAGSGFLYLKCFYLAPTFNLEHASKYILSLPADTILAGQEAPRLTLGTPFRSLLAYENWFNDTDLFVRYRPTHLIVLDRFGGAELGWIRKKYPDVAGHLELVRTFNIWDTTMTLYRVPGVPRPESSGN
jgi:4-amino-4-deoxy-L-arabinose transferase-like glycosyltransferase